MLKGEKIILEHISYPDLEIILNWRNDQKLTQYFRENKILGIEQQKEWFSKITDIENISEYFFLIKTINEYEPVGVCGLNYIHWINRTAQLSLYIGKDHIYIDSEGWADEACKMIEDYGFNRLNLNKIYCEVYEFDEKKILLLEKANYKLEGRFIKHIFRNGSYFDSLYFGKIKRNKNAV